MPAVCFSFPGRFRLIRNPVKLWKATLRCRRRVFCKTSPLFLRPRGSNLGQAVKTTVYLKDLAHFGMMNEVYARFFADGAPARSTVEVARLPRNVSVEIDLIADVEG